MNLKVEKDSINNKTSWTWSSVRLETGCQQPFKILRHILMVCPLLPQWVDCECSWRITWRPLISLLLWGTVGGWWRIRWLPNVHILPSFILISPLQLNFAPLHWIFQSICTILCSYAHGPTNGQTDRWMVKASYSRYIATKNTDLSLFIIQYCIWQTRWLGYICYG